MSQLIHSNYYANYITLLICKSLFIIYIPVDTIMMFMLKIMFQDKFIAES